MSKQARHGRGKRPRDEPLNQELGHQDFPSIDYHLDQTVELGTSQGSINPGSNFQLDLLPPTDERRPKIAIPALRTTHGLDPSRTFKKGRTPHACDHCRKAKSGCSGEQPCSKCRAAHVPCLYGDGKRDKERKRLTKLRQDALVQSQHNMQICEALRRIRFDMTMSQAEMRLALDEVLSMKPPEVDDMDETPFVSQQVSPRPDEFSSDEYLDANGDAASTPSQGRRVIDVESSRAPKGPADVVQKSSSDVWADRTQNRHGKTTQLRPALERFEKRPMLVSYQTQDSDTAPWDMSNVQVFHWPDPSVADALVQSYFDKVHHVLPLLDRQVFMDRYKAFPRGSNDLSKDDSIWLGTLNIVFAISAVYFNLTKTPLPIHYDDHIRYITRARILCLDRGLLYENSRVCAVRAVGLLCLYFIATCNLDRAWSFCALAIRQALTFRLHLENEAEDLQDYRSERCIWWSLFSLECTLNDLTGLPSCISYQAISTPLPANTILDQMRTSQPAHDNFDSTPGFGSHSRHETRASVAQLSFEPSSPITTSTYFIYRTQLCIISHEISTIYCAAIVRSEWADVQAMIRRIDQQLLDWKNALPEQFNIDFDMWNVPHWDHQNALDRSALAMQFFSSKIKLFRPYHCQFEARIQYLSKRPHGFDHIAVDMCLKSARKMINILSAPASRIDTLYAGTAWWDILHYICEALSVLLIEMAFQLHYDVEQTTGTLEDAKKGVRWLSMMSEQSVSARKAWEIFDRLIRPMASWAMFDLPAAAPMPPGYRTRQRDVNMDSYQQREPPWQQHEFGFHRDFENDFGGIQDANTGARELVPNPLDHDTALQNFETIIMAHGQYDEPWQHLFDFPRDGQDVHGPEGGQHGRVESSGPQNQIPGGFDAEYGGQFDPMSGTRGGFP